MRRYDHGVHQDSARMRVVAWQSPSSAGAWANSARTSTSGAPGETHYEAARSCDNRTH
jgi:hypothetical protein